MIPSLHRFIGSHHGRAVISRLFGHPGIVFRKDHLKGTVAQHVLSAEWNRKNAEYFKTNYLHKKLEGVSGGEGVVGALPVRSRFPSGLPQRAVQEVIGVKQFVIIEYLVQLLLRRFQELIRVKVPVRTG
jgi:hypothetical protein